MFLPSWKFLKIEPRLNCELHMNQGDPNALAGWGVMGPRPLLKYRSN